MNTNAAAKQATVIFQTPGSAKWAIGKNTDDTFFLFSQAYQVSPLIISQPGMIGIGTSTPSHHIDMVSTGTLNRSLQIVHNVTSVTGSGPGSATTNFDADAGQGRGSLNLFSTVDTRFDNSSETYDAQ